MRTDPEPQCAVFVTLAYGPVSFRNTYRIDRLPWVNLLEVQASVPGISFELLACILSLPVAVFPPEARQAASEISRLCGISQRVRIEYFGQTFAIFLFGFCDELFQHAI